MRSLLGARNGAWESNTFFFYGLKRWIGFGDLDLIFKSLPDLGHNWNCYWFGRWAYMWYLPISGSSLYFAHFLRKSPYQNFLLYLIHLPIWNSRSPTKIWEFPFLFNHSPYLKKKISLFVISNVSHVRRWGTSVFFKNTDIFLSVGRIHSAVISGVNPEAKSVTVEWFERGETKGKEVILTEPCHEKTWFSHIRTTKVHISLHICAVWSAPLLFAT